MAVFINIIKTTEVDLIKAITNRRSIRDFENKEVKKDLVKKILALASLAPSDENSQPWHYTVVYDQLIKDKIGKSSVKAGQKYFGPKREELEEKFAEMGQERCLDMVSKFTSGELFSFLKTAPVLIIISSQNDFFSHISTGAAVQNLMLTAQEFGLGTCWTVIGLTDEESNNEIKDLAKIDRTRTIISVLAMGYPSRVPKPRGRQDIEDKITWL